MHADAAATGRLPLPWVGADARRLLPALAMAWARLAAIAGQVAVQMAVGALGGAAALGVLQLFQSWTSIGGEVAARGLPVAGMRAAAVDYQRGDGASIRRRLAAAASSIVRGWWPVCLLIALGWLGLSLLHVGPAAEPWRDLTLVAALVAAPLCALLRLAAETLKAMDAPAPAVLVESLVIPLLLLAAAAGCWVWQQPLTTAVLLVSGIAGFLAAPVLLGWRIGRRAGRLEAPDDAAGEVPAGSGDLNTLWGSSLLNAAFLQLPFIVLPLSASTSEIGVYAVANKLMGIITMLLLLLAAVFGPAFARAAVGTGEQLPRLLRRSQQLACIIYLPLAAALLLAGPVLAGLFNVPGPDLLAVLCILAGGHLVNAMTGLSGILLNMTGGSRLELISVGAAVLGTLAASPLVAMVWGYTGLALLFSAAIAVKNLVSYALARYHLQHGITAR